MPHTKTLIALITLSIMATNFAEPVYRLPKVKVDASKKTKEEKLTKKNEDIITCKGIQNEGVNFLTDVLSGRDSIQINDTGNAKTISMRGFGANASSNIKVLYNGISLNTIDLSGSDLNLIDPNLLGEIKIVPLSEGTSHGNNAVAGVISLNNQLPDHSQANITYTQGLPQYSHLSVSATKVINPENKFNVAAFGLTDDPYRKNASANIAQALFTYKHTGERNTTQFFTQAGPERTYFPGGLTQDQVNANRFDSEGTYGRQNNMALLNSLFIKQKMTDQLSASVNITHKSDRGNGRWISPNFPLLSFNYVQNSESETLEPKVQYKTTDQTYVAGIHLKHATFYNTTALDVVSNDSDQNQNSEYLTFKNEFDNGWEIDAGYRWVNIRQLTKGINEGNSHYNFGVASAGLSYHITPMLTWGLRRAGSYRLPLIDENSFSAPNTALKPQEGISYETYILDLHPTWMAGAELYQLRNRNEIAYVPPNIFLGPGTNVNLPKTKRNGILINGAIMPTNNWTLGESLSLMHNRFAQTQHDVPWTVPIDANVHSLLKFKSNWFWVISGHYFGKRYAIDDFNNEYGRFGKVLLFNTAVIYECNKFRASLRVNNLTNRKYYNYAIVNQGQTSFYPAPGIEGLLTLSYTL